MKKIISIIIAFATLLALSALATLTPSALVQAPEFTAQYSHPTVDGEISEGEYANSYVMNKDSAAAWVGGVGNSSVTWHFAWDENGLYYAGTINDTTPSYRDENGYWVGIDCLEISINPGNLLKADDRTEGVFFSFGATKDGKVVAYRHNFKDGLVSDKITGKASGHKAGTDGYTIEVMIPWDLVKIKTNCTVGGKTDIKLDSRNWEICNGTQFSVLPCAIDAITDADGSLDQITAAYKFKDTDFIVRDFLKITLDGKPEETTAEVTTEEITTQAEESTVNAETNANSETTNNENQTSGCNSTVGAFAIMMCLIGATGFIRKKD